MWTDPTYCVNLTIVLLDAIICIVKQALRERVKEKFNFSSVDTVSKDNSLKGFTLETINVHY